MRIGLNGWVTRLSYRWPFLFLFEVIYLLKVIKAEWLLRKVDLFLKHAGTASGRYRGVSGGSI